MSRKPRVEYEGAAYHVMCRGDRQEEIFRDDTDRDRFLETLRDRILKHVDGVLNRGRRKSFSGDEVMAHDEAAAEGLVYAGLKALELAGKDLSVLRKMDVRKQVLAW